MFIIQISVSVQRMQFTCKTFEYEHNSTNTAVFITRSILQAGRVKVFSFFFIAWQFQKRKTITKFGKSQSNIAFDAHIYSFDVNEIKCGLSNA